MKKVISYLITIMMVLTMMPYVAFADNVSDQAAAENENIALYVEQSNELYTGGDAEQTVEVIDVVPFSDTDEGIAPNGSGETEYAETVEEAAAGLRSAMVERQTNVVVNIKVDELTEEALTATADQIFKEAIKHTGNPKEGDSLKWVWENCGVSISGTSDGTNCYAAITYDITYYTTAEQEAALTSAVESLKEELNLDGKTDYEKVKAIYDYMVANISYDYTNLENDSHKLKYTAYAALINKTSVCQGYATLFYRLALEYGIDTRVIAGESLNNNGESERHSWNIVKLGDKYYNLDATWDSTWDSDKTTHDFFLKGSDEFINHNVSEDIVLWLQNYNISSANYKEEPSSIIESGAYMDNINWEISADGTLTISGEGILKDFDESEFFPDTGEMKNTPWSKYKKSIKTIIIESGITEISICVFIQLPNAEYIYIPETVEVIEINQSFVGCPRLRFDVDSNNKWFSSMDGNLFNKSGDTILCMPRAEGDVVIPEGVKIIGPCIFNNYLFEAYNITSITIPDSVVEIGDSAFAHQNDLNNIELSANLERIGISAFAQCKSLKSIQLPNSLNQIGMGAFGGCASLDEIIIPANVERIENTAFAHCSKLKSVTFSNESSLDFIGYYCFFNTPWLENSFKDGFVIVNNLLVACTGNDEYLIIPDEVTDICDGLWGCKSKTVVIPNTVKRISSDSPFSGSNIDRIMFLGDKPKIANENIWDNSFGESKRVEVYYPFDNKTWEETVFRNNADWWYTSEEAGTFGFPYSSLDENGDPILAHVHSWNEGTVIKDPTCTEPGSKYRECACGNSITEEIPVIDHTWDDDYTIDVEPTCTSEGVKSIHCVYCEAITAPTILEYLPHDYEPVVTAPTCTEAGYKTYICECGDTYTADEVAALGHSYDDGVITTEPTCEEDGEKTFTCETCENTYTEKVAAVGHDWNDDYTVDKEATCTKEGSKSIHCSKCDATKDVTTIDKLSHSFGDWEETTAPTCIEKGEETRVCACGEKETRPVDKLDHDYEAVVTAPTCTEEGYTTYTCECGDSYETDYVDAIGHNYSDWKTDADNHWKECECGDVVDKTAHDFEWIVDIEATEETEGSKHQECTVCGSEGATASIVELNHTHDMNKVEAVSATCTEDGNIEHYKCSKCNKLYSDADGKTEITEAETIDPATGHKYGKWEETTEPTCTKEGEETRTCACSEKETRAVDKLGHDYKAVVTAPTCIEPGYTTHTCQREDCGHTYTDNEVAALDHLYDDGVITKEPTCTENGVKTFTCETCGNTYTEKVAAVGHAWDDDYTVDKEASCTEEGSKSIHCSKCDATKDATTIDKLSHSFGNWEVTTEPTCTKEGEETRKCACGEKETKTVDKLAHDYEASVTAPTCEEYGYTTYTCSACKDSYVEDGDDPLDHDYEAVETKPTCTEGGYITYTCKRDASHTYTTDLDPDGHEMKEHAAVEATCEEAGNIAYYTCNVCEGYFLDEKGEEATTADKVVVEATGHKYGAYKTTTKAEFGKDGEQTSTCVTCSDKVTKAIAAPKTIKLSYTEYTYNGKIKKPTVKAVYDSEGNKISSANYKVSYASGRKNVGKYKVTVTFNKNSANYTGSSYTTFKINPKGTSISGLAKVKKGFTVKWKKQTGKMATTRITGYQYRYSTSSKMTNAVTKTVKGYGKTSAKKTGLKAKKTYYVQVRTYKTVKGVKYSSPWSKYKKVKTK